MWHWPVVVAGIFFEYKSFELAGVFLSVVLGFLSFKFIESANFPSFERWSDALKVKPLHFTLMLGFIGSLVFVFRPNQFLFPMKESVLNSIERKPYECFDKEMMHENDDVVCQLTKGESAILAIGDSHSYSSLPAIESIAKSNNLELYYTGFNGCPPIIGVSPIRGDQHLKNCKILNQRALDFALGKQVKTVFLAARWTYYTEGTYSKTGVQYLTIDNNERGLDVSKRALMTGLKDTFKAYFDNGINVVVMLQVPMQKHDPDKIYYRSISNGKLLTSKLAKNSISLEEHVKFQFETNHLIKSLAVSYPNVTIYDPTSDMCVEGQCLVGSVDVSYYFDDDHLSILGARKLVEPISKFLVD
uniref:SGNH hydrolase domain-containing protein n=1 Tax=Aliivibrio salmonicida TaxID=40269 RepID=UPI0015962FE7|nr:SGNH hydrolase domain-containing protein [Aliivibrio salmonicida]